MRILYKKLLKILPVVLVMCVALTSVFAVTVTFDELPTTQFSSERVSPISETFGTIMNVFESYSLLVIMLMVISIVASWKIYSKAYNQDGLA